MKKTRTSSILALFLIAGCAGVQRDCQKCGADMKGANWLIVQRDNAGKASRCWILKDVSVGDSEEVDGIYWQASDSNIVHIAGWFDRVQVNGSWETAASQMGVDLSTCQR